MNFLPSSICLRALPDLCYLGMSGWNGKEEYQVFTVQVTGREHGHRPGGQAPLNLLGCWWEITFWSQWKCETGGWLPVGSPLELCACTWTFTSPFLPSIPEWIHELSWRFGIKSLENTEIRGGWCTNTYTCYWSPCQHLSPHCPSLLSCFIPQTHRCLSIYLDADQGKPHSWNVFVINFVVCFKQKYLNEMIPNVMSDFKDDKCSTL